MILCVQIPRATLNAFTSAELWHSESATDTDWKEWVWDCRKGCKAPRHLQYLEEVDLIRVTTCTTPNEAICQLRSFHHITHLDVLNRSGGGSLTQFYFRLKTEDTLTLSARAWACETSAK